MLTLALLIATTLGTATSHNHTTRQVEHPNYALAKASARINTLNSIMEARKNGERPIRDHLIPPQFWKTSAEVPSPSDDFLLQNVENINSATSDTAETVGTMQIIDDMGINPLDPLNLIDAVVPISSFDGNDDRPETVVFIRRPIALEQTASLDEIVGDSAREADESEEIARPESGILIHPHGGAVVVPDNPRVGIMQNNDEEIVIYTQSDEISSEEIDTANKNATNTRNSVVNVSESAINSTETNDKYVTISSKDKVASFSATGTADTKTPLKDNVGNNTDIGDILKSAWQNETAREINSDTTVGQSQKEVEKTNNSTESTLENASGSVDKAQHPSSRSAIGETFDHRPFSFGHDGMHIPQALSGIPSMQAGEIFHHSGLRNSPHMLPPHSGFFERFALPDAGTENERIPSILNHHRLHEGIPQLPLFGQNEDPAARDIAFTDSIISPIFRSLSENLPRSAESDLRNADADPRHHLHSHTIIHHHGPLRPFIQPGVLPQVALHINQNQQANTPAVQPTFTIPAQPHVLNNNIIPSVVSPYGVAGIPTSSGQVANVNGNSNSLSQNQHSSLGGIGNAAGHIQAAGIHGDVNAVAQHQSVTVARESVSNNTDVSEEPPKKVEKRSAQAVNADLMARKSQPTLHNVFGNRGLQQGINSQPQQFFPPQSGIAVVQQNPLPFTSIPQTQIIPIQQTRFIPATGNMPLTGNIVPSFFRRSNEEVNHFVVSVGHQNFPEKSFRAAEDNSEALARDISQTLVHYEQPLLKERTVVPHGGINFSDIQQVVIPQTTMIDPPDVFPEDQFIPANLRPRPSPSADSNGSANTTQGNNEKGNAGVTNKTQVIPSSAGCSCSNITGQISVIKENNNDNSQNQTVLNSDQASTADQTQQFFRESDTANNTGQVTETPEGNGDSTSLQYQETTLSNAGDTQTTESSDISKKNHQSARSNDFFNSESGQARLGNIINIPRWDISRQSENQERSHFVSKRSLAVTDLFRDPNKKIDVPKTVENIGTITKNSFQNQDAPMYHLNNVVGSIKNVVMSSMKIPPQDLVIPTQYKIVNTEDLDNMVDNPDLQKKSEFTRSISSKTMQEEAESVGQDVPEDDPFNVVDTFQKVGAAVRDSIRSGQDTLTHVGDIAHSARKVVQTARLQTPRVVLPAVMGRSRQAGLNSDRVTLIAPKILDIKDEKKADDRLMQSQSRRDFVRMGDIMDALGVSNPSEDQVEMQKVVINRKFPPRASKEKVGTSNIHPRLSQIEMKKFPVLKPRIQDDRLQKTAPKPKNKNLKDFVTQMRNDLGSLVKDKIDAEKKSRVLQKNRNNNYEAVTAGDDVLGKVTNRLDRLKSVNEGIKTRAQAVKEKIGDAIEPLKDIDLSSNTDSARPRNFQDVGKPTEKLKDANKDTDYWDEQVESFLTDLFSANKNKPKDDDSEVVGSVLNSNAETVGRVYIFEKDLLTPFMGRASKKDIKSFLKLNENKKPKKVARYYGEDEEEGDEGIVGSPLEQNDMAEKNKMEQVQKVLGAVNPLMFEKMFNETLRNNNMSSVTPYALFSNNDRGKDCKREEKVGTSMTMTRVMLKPFMGSKIDKGDMYEIFPIRPEDNKEEKYNESY